MRNFGSRIQQSNRGLLVKTLGNELVRGDVAKNLKEYEERMNGLSMAAEE
jgi:hypothetical protein